MSSAERLESDSLGQKKLPASAYYGIHTLRAMENFPLSGRSAHPELIKAYGLVKLSCFRANRLLGEFDDETVASAVETACREMAAGVLLEHVCVDALQGGAGTSLNMNVNEVLANRALEILGKARGSYDVVSPLDDINRHQSTNDTFPTALKLASIRLLLQLEAAVTGLQEVFQAKEKEFSDVVKVGRTELQDAVLTTLGREMSAYAEAFSRDRWRIYKCAERLRVINLGGTAIGTGIGAPREYIFRVTDELKALSGIPFARAENLIDATQNADVFVEVSGILKALAVSLLKCSSDLRLLSSGPGAGIGEILLPPRQSGSSIMPGKINPVIPEAVSQVCLLVMGHDQTIASAAALGNLELNQFMPLIANCLLESVSLLSAACVTLSSNCVAGICANRKVCAASLQSSTAVATALAGRLGYEAAAGLLKEAQDLGISIGKHIVNKGILSEEEFKELISPEAVTRLGQ